MKLGWVERPKWQLKGHRDREIQSKHIVLMYGIFKASIIKYYLIKHHLE